MECGGQSLLWQQQGKCTQFTNMPRKLYETNTSTKYNRLKKTKLLGSRQIRLLFKYKLDRGIELSTKIYRETTPAWWSERDLNPLRPVNSSLAPQAPSHAASCLTLKEQCHEDFAALGQFCAKIITKCSCKATTKISNEFDQRGLTMINFLRIFGTRSIKIRKSWPIFSSFNLFPSMPSVATGDRKQFQYLQIVLNNKTRSLVLEFN